LLRGKTFDVGDRITTGGVRGDVLVLGFTQTRIMEMGKPPSMDSDGAGMWMMGRQFMGRLVTVTNDRIFDQPLDEYGRCFPPIRIATAPPSGPASGASNESARN
jgi:small-conductance mechanosensitive channel